tara:strand:- start:512 stop:640 length:129 start_codon:yes stop_codon:yes gene_type:complete
MVSETDLKIMEKLDKKQQYYENEIEKIQAEKKYFYKKWGFDR